MIYIGSDYAGYKLKYNINKFLDSKKIGYIDIGTFSDKIINDFTDFIPPIVKNVKKSSKNFGVLICGTGLGMSIGANRFKGIRAALVFDVKQARYSKTHDNANVLVFSSWATNSAKANKILYSWLKTRFKPLARRVKRFKKIDRWPT